MQVAAIDASSALGLFSIVLFYVPEAGYVAEFKGRSKPADSEPAPWGLHPEEPENNEREGVGGKSRGAVQRTAQDGRQPIEVFANRPPLKKEKSYSP